MEALFANSLDNVLRELYHKKSVGSVDLYSLDCYAVSNVGEVVRYLSKEGYIEELVNQQYRLTSRGIFFCESNSYCFPGKSIII